MPDSKTRKLRIFYRDRTMSPSVFPVADDYRISFDEQGWLRGPDFVISGHEILTAQIVEEETQLKGVVSNAS